MEPFLLNHQYNRIAQQARFVLSAQQTSSDRKVVEASRYQAVRNVLEACPELTGEQLQLVERISAISSSEELEVYLSGLLKYVVSFPEVTERALKDLFPKVKKLRMPEAGKRGGRPLTYLGWRDPATQKLYLVYAIHSPDKPSPRLAGVEGRCMSLPKKGLCAFCQRTGETLLLTVVSSQKFAHLPDYFKSIGQYVCEDSETCNTRITDPAGIDAFFQAALKS